MPSTLLSQLIAFPTSLLLGGWLALISCSSSVQAKTIPSDILIEPLPSSLSPGILYAQQSLPELEPSSPRSVIEFQRSKPPRVAPGDQYNQHYEQRFPEQHDEERFARYLVFVNSDNIDLLQQVRSIEPGAYIREFRGRPVIQVGAFTREYNAQQRLEQLRSYGIDRTEIARFSDTEESPNYSYTERSPNDFDHQEPPNHSDIERSQSYSHVEESSGHFDRYDEHRNRSRSYYVVIPTNFEDLPLVESQIRRSVGPNARVIARNHPRGLHVAVGPFVRELEAEQWNDYLRHLGFGGARVYYGS